MRSLLPAFLTVLVTVLAAPPLWACSCASYEPVQACEVVATTTVVFRGRVVDHNDDTGQGFVQWTLYRVRVLEAFKGVPAGVQEVFIDPGSYTSCYGGLPTDGELLVYASAPRTPRTFAQFYESVKGRPSRDGTIKPLPPAWAPLGGLPVFHSHFCLPSRRVSPDDPNLAFLREAAAGKITGGLLEGWVAQSSDASTPSYAERVPLPGATITVTGGAGPRQTHSGLDGRYRIDGLTPGSYAVTVEKPGYTASRAPATFTLVPGSCRVERTTLQTSASVSGVVLGRDGVPARGVRVELGQLGDDGKVRYIRYYHATSDAQGRFLFERVPAVRIVAGLNLDGAPSKREPYEAVYAPGHSPLSKAQVLNIVPDARLTGISLQLPPPLPFGNLIVEVLWPDGSPAIGARAFAESKGGRSAFESAPRQSHRVALPLALGRQYQISADWISSLAGRHRYVDSPATTVLFRADRQTVTIVLKDKIE